MIKKWLETRKKKKNKKVLERLLKELTDSIMEESKRTGRPVGDIVSKIFRDTWLREKFSFKVVDFNG